VLDGGISNVNICARAPRFESAGVRSAYINQQLLARLIV